MKRNSGWQSILRSAECREVLAQVAALGKKGERVYPIQKDVFRAFEDCPFKKVRVVIPTSIALSKLISAIRRSKPARAALPKALP
jgi:hypothetical protein